MFLGRDECLHATFLTSDAEGIGEVRDSVYTGKVWKVWSMGLFPNAITRLAAIYETREVCTSHNKYKKRGGGGAVMNRYCCGSDLFTKCRRSNGREVKSVMLYTKHLRCTLCVFFFLPIHSGHQVRWTYQSGSHRRKVTQDFSSTFLRCVP